VNRSTVTTATWLHHLSWHAESRGDVERLHELLLAMGKLEFVHWP